MRLYLDSAPIIYLIENVQPYASRLEEYLSPTDTIQVCSDLTRLECRVQPIANGETALLTAFDRYFAGIISEIIPLSREILDLATVIRAEYRFKTPDAIHLAAATISECNAFVTNDKRLQNYRGIPVIVP